MNVSQGPISAARRALALLNSQASTSGTQVEWLQLFEESGGLVLTTSNATELSQAFVEAERQQRSRLIIVGGDGSISRVANELGCDTERFELALVPAGTGNDLARSLGIPIDDPAQAWNIALNGLARPIDMIAIGGTERRFVNVATAGFGGRQAAEAAREQKSYLGQLAYWLSAAMQLGDMPEYEVLFTIDGQAQTLRCVGFWIANGRYVGGGFPAAPHAIIDDGLLDIVAIPAMPALELLTAGVDFALLGPEQSEWIVNLRAAQMSVTTIPKIPLSIDGEPYKTDALECHVLPKALRVVVGALSPAVSSGVAAERG